MRLTWPPAAPTGSPSGLWLGLVPEVSGLNPGPRAGGGRFLSLVTVSRASAKVWQAPPPGSCSSSSWRTRALLMAPRPLLPGGIGVPRALSGVGTLLCGPGPSPQPAGVVAAAVGVQVGIGWAVAGPGGTAGADLPGEPRSVPSGPGAAKPQQCPPPGSQGVPVPPPRPSSAGEDASVGSPQLLWLLPPLPGDSRGPDTEPGGLKGPCVSPGTGSVRVSCACPAVSAS